MVDSMAYISFLFSFVLLLSSHVLTHKVFREEKISENRMMNVDWYNPSARRFKVLPRKGGLPPPNSGHPRPWSERSNPWPGGSLGPPPLHARQKKNKHNASSPPHPPSTKMDHYSHSFAFHYNDGFISEMISENTVMNVEGYNPSSRKYRYFSKPRAVYSPVPRDWFEHSNPWPRPKNKPVLKPRLKKNENITTAPRRPPPPTDKMNHHYAQLVAYQLAESYIGDGSVTRHRKMMKPSKLKK